MLIVHTISTCLQVTSPYRFRSLLWVRNECSSGSTSSPSRNTYFVAQKKCVWQTHTHSLGWHTFSLSMSSQTSTTPSPAYVLAYCPYTTTAVPHICRRHSMPRLQLLCRDILWKACKYTGGVYTLTCCINDCNCHAYITDYIHITDKSLLSRTSCTRQEAAATHPNNKVSMQAEWKLACKLRLHKRVKGSYCDLVCNMLTLPAAGNWVAYT